eukprot:TRINITY_DN14040_c0_g1_i1.p2 TRINITY_DN14040_c0_g1~~TRINITY_DN14040_c0_g1_i1.p2  ORF type:complete len:360 (+),score=78.97 TRINITY_DN14040_c0_g1_i1:80-1081(+)
MSAARGSWNERLCRFYHYYNPSKVVVVPDMLRDARGHEEALFATLVGMYGPEPPMDVQPVCTRERLRRFYELYNPERIPDIDRLLHQCAGHEDALFAALVQKYGPEPAAPAGCGGIPAHAGGSAGDARLRRTRQLAGLRAITTQAQGRLRMRCLAQWLHFLWLRRGVDGAAAGPQSAAQPATPPAWPDSDEEEGTVVIHHHHHRPAAQPCGAHSNARPGRTRLLPEDGGEFSANGLGKDSYCAAPYSAADEQPGRHATEMPPCAGRSSQLQPRRERSASRRSRSGHWRRRSSSRRRRRRPRLRSDECEALVEEVLRQLASASLPLSCSAQPWY